MSTKLIVNTISSMKLSPKKQIAKGKFKFTAHYIPRDAPNLKILKWVSKRFITNPTESSLAKQAQKFLSETGDWHAYLEGIEIKKASREIHMLLGS